jgi:dissimilatory sulfite reductase (desulfoviridin) alpha/beta subunit
MEIETPLCPLGFNCFQMGLLDGQHCINEYLCQEYCNPWPLPYRYDEKGCLTVCVGVYHEDLSIYGWANAEKIENKTENNIGTDEFAQLIRETNIEIRRLGWPLERCRHLLREMTGKRSRSSCTLIELEEFLRYLQSQPELEE